MDLIRQGPLAAAGRFAWPNTMIFPKELRDAIPEHSARALALDSVDGTVRDGPYALAGLAGAIPPGSGPRTFLRLDVHETGKSQSVYPVWIDLDPATMRALGRFMIDLADRAEAG